MTFWTTFRWPLAIAILTATGLVTGLVSDGWGDALAGLGLLVPAVVATWFGLKSR